MNLHRRYTRKPAFFAACVATVIASGADAAVNLPNTPLETGAQFPPPNVMFILDDSYSMGLNYMPSVDTDILCDDSSFPGIANDKPMACRTALKNTLAYNPTVSYQAWMQGNGTRMTANTAFTSASSHQFLVNTGDNVNLSSAVQTYYVPKSTPLTTAQANDKANYIRWQIRTDGKIVQSEWLNRKGSGFNNEAALGCTTSNSGMDWRNCAEGVPVRTGNSVALEKTNYATWYSYHRTRMKAAKAGASEAFYGLPDNLRMGFTNIHADSTSLFEIPVGSDGGLFRGTNKTDWFNKLLGENVPSVAYTPLRTGLAAVGEYYEGTADTGPWGPAPQLACRQSFAILTTDGYWNKQDEGSAPARSALNEVNNEDGTGGPNGYAAVVPYADDHSKTLADVAMKYWKNDLRTDLNNQVPASSVDSATWQHMSTFAISLGLEGNMTRTALPDARSDWANPDPGTTYGDANGIDDLWHASINGRGSFVVASDSQSFQRGLLNAFKLVADRTGSASNVTSNSTSVTTSTRIYQAKYVSGSWSGELQAYGVSASGVAANPSWTASGLLDANTTRKFFTWDPTLRGNQGDGATFPTTAQSNALDASTRLISPATSAQNVAYLKGVRSGEGDRPANLQNGLRVRTTVLGDIVNSSPFFVADTNTAYVGANDGMLHAFNAANGQELFTYVPNLISFTNLASLSSKTYAHQYFVDGPVVVTTREQTPGHNYLIGSLGRGGRGLFGLDVTTPATFGAGDVMWEITDANLGMVMGEPLIATSNDAGKKVAIVGNGLNSTNGRAALYVVDIETGTYTSIVTGDLGADNGLFAPRGWDDDNNGTVDYVYAGDRRGNLWKFDFRDDTPSVANGGNPIFRAGPSQPITTGVAIGNEPVGNRRWVFFGTGSFMLATDPADATVQSMYGIIDSDTTVARADLQERDILVATVANNRKVRGFERAGAMQTGKKGWFIDLDTPQPGERVVTRPQVRGSVLVFSSRLPPTSDPCNPVGTGYVNALDAFTGASTTSPYLDGNGTGGVGDADVVTVGGVTVPIGSVDLGVGMPTQPTVLDELIVVGGSSGNLGSVQIRPLGGEPRRASWQEIPGD